MTQTSTKRYLVPLQLSPRVFLCHPEGFDHARTSLRAGAILLPCIPSEAFGDGSHPTTRICAGAVDLLCGGAGAPTRFLDVGTGNGVLARIARARGVAEIEATDIDEMALSSARANSKLDKTEISIGFSNRMPHDFELTFDLVIANILEGPLRELAHPLAQAVRPGGVLLLSGFTRLQIPSVKVAFERVGLIAEGESTLEEWCLLKLKQPILRS